jgi:hypothetical protein
MRKFYIAGLALVAVLAFGALSAGSAFASEEKPELLIGKVTVTAEKELNGTGEIELIDAKTPLGEASVLCSGVLMGNVLSGGKTGEITSVLSLTGVAVTEAAPLACTNVKNCAEPLVFAENMPWATETVFMAPPRPWKWLLQILGKPGWHVECMTLKISDVCTASGASPFPGFLLENMTGGVLLAVFLRTETEEEKSQTECTLSKEKTGYVNSDEESGTLESGTSELEIS